jgi:hypothetical protein
MTGQEQWERDLLHLFYFIFTIFYNNRHQNYQLIIPLCTMHYQTYPYEKPLHCITRFEYIFTALNIYERPLHSIIRNTVIMEYINCKNGESLMEKKMNVDGILKFSR